MQGQVLASWIAGVCTILGALLGAVLTHVYRDWRNRPLIDASLESVGRSKSPISLPDDLYSIAYPLGTFQKWAGKLIKWDVDEAFEDNKFTEEQLKDLLHLLPQFLKRHCSRKARAERTVANLANPTNPPSNEMSLRLAGIRAYWLTAFQEDVFVSYAKDPDAVAAKLKSDAEGDLTQATWMIDGCEKLLHWLEAGLAPSAAAQAKIQAAPVDPESPRKPYLVVELLVQNRGKTETLIKDYAELVVNKKTFALRGLIKALGFDVYAGKYFAVRPASMVGITLSQDPDETTMAQLSDLKQGLLDRRHKAFVKLQDYAGRTYKTETFAFREE